MKRIIFIMILIFLFVGCQNINDLDYDKIINNVVSSNHKITNQYRTGYKYYLPKGLQVEYSREYNEKLSSNKTNYYLFIDFLSYINKKEFTYSINDNAYYSQAINNNKKFGYIEINEDDNKFYIEMMYNYAKIEVVTNREDIKQTINRSIALLSSIQYNDKIIANIIGDNILSFKEEKYNIFEPKENPKRFIDYIQDNEDSKDSKNKIPDYDLVK